jgi:hypothetical protein
MGGVSSIDNNYINRQEHAVNDYYNKHKNDLSCGGKYTEGQIKGKLRQQYNSYDKTSYSRSDDYVLSYDASNLSKGSYANASNYFRHGPSY